MTLSFSFELPQTASGPVSATFTHTPAPRRIMVAIADASGAVYGARLLQVLQDTPGIEPHLMVSPAGWHSIEHELDMDRNFVEDMAHRVHVMDDSSTSLASSTHGCSAMVIAPCSSSTLAALAHGLGSDLLTRTADAMLRERRRLVLMVCETPLHLAQLRNMLSVTEMGAIVCPPCRRSTSIRKTCATSSTTTSRSCSTCSKCRTSWPTSTTKILTTTAATLTQTERKRLAAEGHAPSPAWGPEIMQGFPNPQPLDRHHEPLHIALSSP